MNLTCISIDAEIVAQLRGGCDDQFVDGNAGAISDSDVAMKSSDDRCGFDEERVPKGGSRQLTYNSYIGALKGDGSGKIRE